MYLKEETENTLIIEKSRFICYIRHVKNEEEYREYLNEIRKKHRDATHVCSALICHSIRRSSDDGEPSGTAGSPILNVLDKNGMDETCALVVRYFGGIKLGAGGLIRAYSGSVSECLKKGVKVIDQIYPRYRLKLSYEAGNRIDHYLTGNSIILDRIYDDEITYIFALDDDRKLETIKEYTRGILPEKIGEECVQKVVE